MQWFKHDSDANMDGKLQEVLLDYGLEGYGLYFYCLELIVNKISNDNLTFELEHDARIIARNTGSTVQKVEQMMKSFVKLGLFQPSLNGRVKCTKLLSRLDSSMTSNKTMRVLIQTAKNKHSHDGVMMIPDLVMQEENRIEENRKEKKKNGCTEEFKKFWDLYPSKVSKKAASISFQRLSKEKQQLAITDIKNGRFQDRKKNFIPNPTTYLNGERWEDEIEITPDDYERQAMMVDGL